MPKSTPTQAPSSRPRSQPRILRADGWEKIPWLVHGFSTRQGGSSKVFGKGALNLGYTSGEDKRLVAANRAAFLRALGACAGSRAWPLVTLRQIHSAIIHKIDRPASRQMVGDGLITRRPGVVLAVQTADCLPVLLVDTRTRAVGAFHAGWRGTFARIVEKGVGEMRLHFGTRPQDILATIGPGVGACCYEVGDELLDKFATQFDYAAELFEEVFDSDALHIRYPLLFMNQRAPGHGLPPRKWHLNLLAANRRQLLAAGVPPENISASGLCTSCHTKTLFSFRAERGKTGRLMGAVGIRARS